MKKLVNKQNADNVIYVENAYVNGSLLVCEAGMDIFELWRNCWEMEDCDPREIILHPSVALAKKWLPLVPEDFWTQLGVESEIDQVRISITREGRSKSLGANRPRPRPQSRSREK